MALTGVDHKRLVEAHIDGDEEAFAAIVRAYYESLFAHAMRRMGDAHAAEDAVQETLSRAYRALPRFSGDYQLRAWLHRILTNVCHDEGRRRQRENQVVERVAATYAEVPPVDHDLGALDLPRREVLDALAALPASYRDALVLRYIDELSFHDVARATGISEGNARLRVHRGRAALRRALAPLAGVIVFLAPFLRRGQRAALAAQLSADTHVALVSSAPAATRVAETSITFIEKAPSLSGMIGVAASLVVPAAIPVMSNQVPHRVAQSPAAVAAPLPPEGTPPTAQAPATGAPGSTAAPAVTTTVPGGSTTTTAPPAVTSTTVGLLQGSAVDPTGKSAATETDADTDTGRPDPDATATETDQDADTEGRKAPERGTSVTDPDGTEGSDEQSATDPPVALNDEVEEGDDAGAVPEAPAGPVTEDTVPEATAPDDSGTMVAEAAPTTTVPPAAPTEAQPPVEDIGGLLTGFVVDDLGTVAWESSPVPPAPDAGDQSV